MDDVARVVLALEEHDVVEEVMHFLDRTGRARVVGTATDDRQLVEAIRQLEPDAIVAQPSLVDGAVRGRPWLAVETRESVAALRAAIAAGARGFFLWPGEREALAGAAAATLARIDVVERRAKVFGIHASRGGAGATFVATHLARAFARRGSSVILIDADPVFADIGVALGATADHVDEPLDGGASLRTLGDLLPLGGEIGPRQLEQVLWEHPEAFRVLLAPPPEDAARVEAADLEGAVRAAASDADVVLVQLPSALGGATAGLVATVDQLVEVLTLDVLAFRAATRFLHGLHPAAAGDRVVFVVNRASRGEIVPADVERVFGRAALAVLPFDRAVAKAQDHGRLLPPRGRIARICDRLAARLEEETP
ncbi:MAG TPA: hypothetical protein VIE12_04440 [Actinomycetota bacterium]|jgi:MinD-like ATPase involved in chromosome partitioning or flagellar assembly